MVIANWSQLARVALVAEFSEITKNHVNSKPFWLGRSAPSVVPRGILGRCGVINNCAYVGNFDESFSYQVGGV